MGMESDTIAQGEERFQNLLQAIPDIIYKIDPAGRFVFVNDSIRRLGYEPADLIGKHFSEILHPDDVARVSRENVLPKLSGKLTGDDQAPRLFDERRTRMRMTKNLEVRLRPKNRADVKFGEVFAYGEIISTGQFDRDIRNHNKTFLGTVGIIRDVTDRKTMEEKQKRLQEQLIQSEKLRALGEVLSSVAHELNNPLTAIIGYAQLMQSAENIESCRSDLDAIRQEAKRCADIVQNLVAFARKKGFRREPCRINQLIANTLKFRSYQMTVDSVRVSVSMDDRIPQTMADPNQLQQVFLNIVNNALDAMKKSQVRRLEVTSHLVGEIIRVSFADSGCGISTEHLGRIFQPFFTTKTASGGTGLGLSVCYGIVTDHGGRIRAESEPEKGATFVVELPVVAPPLSYEFSPQDAEEPRKAPQAAAVLVVDDERSCLDVFERYLRQVGWSVQTADTVGKAIDLLDRTKFSLIVSDHKMPGRGGEELYEHVARRHPRLLDRFILVSGDVINPASRLFIEKSRVRVLEKPFAMEKLSDLMSEVLEA